jgi:lactoylglutathione lyase
MDDAATRTANVRQVVPLLNVSDMAASLAFYVDGLGFRITNQWVPEGVLRWCWLELDGIALMIQQTWADGVGPSKPPGPVGQGVSLCIMCQDALAVWRAARKRGLSPDRPFVGNTLWVVSFRDPDGYRLDFESPTDAPEESVYEGD